MLHYSMRSIGMDFQLRGQAAHRGKRLSQRQLAAMKAFFAAYTA
jgi:hypothetical protein